MKKYMLVILLCAPVFAQVPNVAISSQPASPAVTVRTSYTSAGNPQYVCKAFTAQPVYQWAITPSSQQGTLTSIAVASNVGTATMAANHGLHISTLR